MKKEQLALLTERLVSILNSLEVSIPGELVETLGGDLVDFSRQIEVVSRAVRAINKNSETAAPNKET